MKKAKSKITVLSVLTGIIALSFAVLLAWMSLSLWIEIFEGNFDVLDSVIPINLVIMFVGLVPIIFLLNFIYKVVAGKTVEEELAYFRFVFSGRKED